MSALCVTCETSAASVTESGISQDFHVGTEVTILSVSLFVLGLGIGPLLAGLLSEVYRRNFVYQTSFALLTAFTFGVAFAPNIVVSSKTYTSQVVHLVFRFLGGFNGSSFLTVAGGSVSDLFENRQVEKSRHWSSLCWVGVNFGSIPITYLVAAYRPVAASAMASNSAMRYSFGACFPLFAGQMYTQLGTVGATALLAGLMIAAALLPYERFYHLGVFPFTS
ncbi:hypothetical protein GYMLUDRAFT_252642 [Collybiopsis luxurians FD-317 M1]|uniref:Major facilitator superfamily (MFS) profile domain-containing protein n=1 Tax=Collybiopsis luxurians FD-317 M1 TaxID=944289 RepID=A0A0D0C7M5_9AGAR|nr:hypothetical protein GYMLUDRAFT_252642 [Collybiopsis luxurians FD-317 M1]